MKPFVSKHKRPIIAIAVVVGLFLCWGLFLFTYASFELKKVDGLSASGGVQKGTTYLIVAIDQKPSQPNIRNARADSIFLLNTQKNKSAKLIQIPRDTFAPIPGLSEPNLIKNAYSVGGVSAVVQSVQSLTDLHIDHFVVVNYKALKNAVNAVNGVTLCYDKNVDDKRSGLKWSAGCHKVKGKKALAFARMRYSDPSDDTGRTVRQRQIINAVISKAKSPGFIAYPWNQTRLIKYCLKNLQFDSSANIFTVLDLATNLKSALSSEATQLQVADTYISNGQVKFSTPEEISQQVAEFLK